MDFIMCKDNYFTDLTVLQPIATSARLIAIFALNESEVFHSIFIGLHAIHFMVATGNEH